MLLNAMLLNPGGPPWGLIVAVIALIGITVGFLWIRRIAAGDEDPNASFWRSHPRGGHGSRLPAMPAIRRPTGGWLVTRGAIAFGVATIALAVIGPLVLRRWDRALDLGPLAVVVWVAAIAAAMLGTAWMVRIALRGPDDGAAPWRYRR